MYNFTSRIQGVLTFVDTMWRLMPPEPIMRLFVNRMLLPTSSITSTFQIIKFLEANIRIYWTPSSQAVLSSCGANPSSISTLLSWSNTLRKTGSTLMSLFTLTYTSTTHQQMDEYTNDKWKIYFEPFPLHLYH